MDYITNMAEMYKIMNGTSDFVVSANDLIFIEDFGKI